MKPYKIKIRSILVLFLWTLTAAFANAQEAGVAGPFQASFHQHPNSIHENELGESAAYAEFLPTEDELFLEELEAELEAVPTIAFQWDGQVVFDAENDVQIDREPSSTGRRSYQKLKKLKSRRSAAKLQSSAVASSLTAASLLSQETRVLPMAEGNINTRAGASFALTTRFDASPMDRNYAVFVHFTDASGATRFQGDYFPSPGTSQWSGPISQSRWVRVPSNIPNGVYSVRLGLYEYAPPYLNRQAMTADTGVTVDSELRYTIGTVTVGGSESTQVLQLANSNLSGQPGQVLNFTSRFQAVPMAERYGIFVHFVDSNGGPNRFSHHIYPDTTSWSGSLSYNHSVTIPASLPEGTYTVRMGLFRNIAPYGERIQLTMGPGVNVDNELRYIVGSLTVGSSAQVPAPEPQPQPQPQPTGNRPILLTLANPNLTAVSGQAVTMGMRWSAMPMAENYQVFVHLVAADGSQYPGGDHAPSVPTSQWSGSVAYNNTRVLSGVPAGTYSIRAGLYRNSPPYLDRIALDAGAGVSADNETRYTIGTLTVTPGSSNPTPPPTGDAVPTGQDPNQFELTFRDEFNGGFNTEVWNDTIWYEQSNPTKNYTVENGVLKIWPQRDASGRFFNRTIDTDGKYYQTYGFFEIEAKLPHGYGTWPAFWLFNHIGDRRPEIDVMEAYAGGGPDSGWSDANFHPTAFAATVWITLGQQHGHKTIQTPDLSAGFHKYAVKWEPNRLTFYFDGREFWTTSVSFNDPMYLMLDLWYGSASGDPNASGSPKPPEGKGNSYEVNYIRAWRFR